MNMEVFGVAIVVVVILIVVFLRMGKGVVNQGREQILAELEAARALTEKDIASQKLAVIRCDILLGKALEYDGQRGETVGDRLKKARGRFPKDLYNDIWTAHKLRNTLVHENYELGTKETAWAISVYTSAIRRLVK